MIVITGATGLLGAAVLSKALGSNRPVTGISNRSNIPIHSRQITLDLTDFVATREVIRGLSPSIIIHCAAATNVDWCEGHPEAAHQVNTRASSVLAQLAQEIGARFVHISTDSVFDGSTGNYSENDSPAPLNVYARTKLLAEQEVLRVHPSPLVLRVNFYGWNIQNKQSLAEWILNQLSDGRTVPGFSDVHFCPMFVNDVAEIVLRMLDRGMTGIYHLVGSEKISKFEFARRLATVFGFSPDNVLPISMEQAKLRALRPRDTSLNTQKLANNLSCVLPDVNSGLTRFRVLSQQKYVRGAQPILAGAEK